MIYSNPPVFMEDLRNIFIYFNSTVEESLDIFWKVSLSVAQAINKGYFVKKWMPEKRYLDIIYQRCII